MRGVIVTKISELQGKKVFIVKKARQKRGKKQEEAEAAAIENGISPDERLAKLGKIHMAVFTPDGMSMVGFLVKRPDAAGVVKRDDMFLAFDSYAPCQKGVRATRGDDSFDDRARERLGVDWDACIMWAGMDAQTKSGKELGYVNDAEFDEKTGRVTKFLVGDGGMANALVGSLEIPPRMVVGYSKGRMIVTDEAGDLELNGGLAAKAGEASAKAKVRGKEFGEKAGKVTSEAVDKGSYALGKAIGKARKAVREAQEENEEAERLEAAKTQPQAPSVEAEAVHVSDPTPELPVEKDSNAKPKTYAPKSDAKASTQSGTKSGAKKTATKTQAPKKPTKKDLDDAGEKAARAFGRGLSSMNKMFSDFKDEYDKASK